MRRTHRIARVQRAFTLIELLLVMAILATLAVIIVPKFTRRGEQAKVQAAKTSLDTLTGAMETFEVDNSRYPTSEEGLDALVKNPGSLSTWRGPYIRGSATPKDPWGNAYVYRQPGQHNTEDFDLYSFGPDGQDGTPDDITNWQAE